MTDRKGALQAIGRCKAGLGRVQSVLTDSGYTGKPFAQGVREALGEHVTVQVAKRSERKRSSNPSKSLNWLAHQIC